MIICRFMTHLFYIYVTVNSFRFKGGRSAGHELLRSGLFPPQSQRTGCCGWCSLEQHGQYPVFNFLPTATPRAAAAQRAVPDGGGFLPRMPLFGIWWKVRRITGPRLPFFFKVESSLRAPFPLFGLGSVHSGSAS